MQKHVKSPPRRARVSRELTVGEGHLANIVRSSEDAILSKSLDGFVLSWNAAAERLFGYTEDEIVGRPVALLIPDHLQAEETALLLRIRDRETIRHYETLRRRKDGGIVEVSLTLSPITGAHGDVLAASTFMRDVTDRRRAEAQAAVLQAELAHVSRLTSMGQMASGIAHELNQPLTVISNYANAIQDMLSNARPAQLAQDACEAIAILDKVKAQAFRATAIIKKLRALVEKRQGERRPEDLNAVVRDAVGFALLGTPASGVAIRYDLARSLDAVLIDRVQIQQVIVNLVRNSIEAMEGRPDKAVDVVTRPGRPGFVELRLSDTGPGLPAPVAERLFEPFVTTKPDGMGIGLTLCQSIVGSHGGEIALLDGPGAVFRILLPVAEMPIPARTPPAV